MRKSSFVTAVVAVALLAAAPALAAKKPPVHVAKVPAAKICGVYYRYSC
jgi:hypothetical protein